MMLKTRNSFLDYGLMNQRPFLFAIKTNLLNDSNMGEHVLPHRNTVSTCVDVDELNVIEVISTCYVRGYDE